MLYALAVVGFVFMVYFVMAEKRIRRTEKQRDHWFRESIRCHPGETKYIPNREDPSMLPEDFE